MNKEIKSYIIRTVEELHALPLGTVVQLKDGSVAQRVDEDSEGLDWMFVGSDEYRTPDEFNGPGMLPVVVLTSPVSEPTEVRVEAATNAIIQLKRDRDRARTEESMRIHGGTNGLSYLGGKYEVTYKDMARAALSAVPGGE